LGLGKKKLIEAKETSLNWISDRTPDNTMLGAHKDTERPIVGGSFAGDVNE
jgi:hypothetical protein